MSQLLIVTLLLAVGMCWGSVVSAQTATTQYRYGLMFVSPLSLASRTDIKGCRFIGYPLGNLCLDSWKDTDGVECAGDAQLQSNCLFLSTRARYLCFCRQSPQFVQLLCRVVPICVGKDRTSILESNLCLLEGMLRIQTDMELTQTGHRWNEIVNSSSTTSNLGNHSRPFSIVSICNTP